MSDQPADLRGKRTGRKLRQLGIDTSKATPAVADLSIQDLYDLADKFRGVDTHNPDVTNLSVEDLTSLENVFRDLKVAKAEVIVTGSSPNALVSAEQLCDDSCCCCTPCCCCT